MTHGNDVLSFISYDYEHHRIAIIGRPSTSQKPPGEISGLAHIAFGFKNLSELAQSYQEKKSIGIMPCWTVNHGMSTSMYYYDPDGNELEVQVDNFETSELAIEFMESDAFARNPVGVDYDPEEFVRRVESGEDEKSIMARPDIGIRTRK